MEGRTGADQLSLESSQLLSSLLNGSESVSSLASSLAQLPDAKNLLSQILAGSQPPQSTSSNNLQQVLSAAAVSLVTQQQPHQRLPTLKPTNSSPTSHSQVVTTPTQPTPTAGRKRGRPPASDQEDSLRKRKGGGYSSAGRGGGEKQSKGLRHFSQLVCEKVREKGITSYNEVADELVRELDEQEQKSGNEMQIDQKNIRRRVYDALNVLMAMNIISKEKKEIRWIGLPTNSVQECEHIQAELSQYEERISRKKSELHELVLQILTLKNLMKRNCERAESGDPPTPNSAIGLPFILVNTSKNTVIDCSISSDKSEYVFNFDNTFELHQDVDVLKKMGLECGLHTGTSTPESLALAKSLLPKMLEPVLDEMAEISALSTTVAPQSPSHDPQPVPSPSTPLPHSTASSVLTPLLNDISSGPTYSSSPLGVATSTAFANNSPNAIAAALSTLQQLQQISGQSSSTPALPSTQTASPNGPPLQPSSSSLIIPSPSNAVTLPGSTVTARPISVSSKTPVVPISPLIKTQVPLSTVGSGPAQGRSPGAKLVTVQPLPGNASVADIIASLQQNVSTLLKQQQQQQQQPGSLSTGTTTFNSLFNTLQPQSSPINQQQKKSLLKEHASTASPGKFLTHNPTT